MLTVAILGVLEVAVDGRPVPLGGPRSRALLVRLATAGRHAVAAEALIDELWDRPIGNPRHALQAQISRLRSVLPGYVQNIGGGYRLDPAATEVDAEIFRERYDDGRRQLVAGSPERAAEKLREALACWRGPALADLTDVVGLRSLAAGLDEARANALSDRIDADLASYDPRSVLAELHSLVLDEPLMERHWAQLMVALYRDGRASDALAAYRNARAALRRELGTEPGATLQQLHQIVLAGEEIAWPPGTVGDRIEVGSGSGVSNGIGDGIGDGSAAVAGFRAGAGTRRQAMVGRDRELDDLRRAWAEAHHGLRVVVITGEAGIGKTRLATEFADELAGAGATVRFGRCEEALAGSYQPLVQILRASAADVSANPPRRWGPHMAELVRLVPELADVIGPPVPAVEGAVASSDAFRMAEALADWLAMAGVRQPPAWVIDDAHWCDPDTTLLLESLARTRRSLRGLIVLTYRDHRDPAADERLSAWVRQSDVVGQLALTGLEGPAVSAILDEELTRGGWAEGSHPAAGSEGAADRSATVTAPGSGTPGGDRDALAAWVTAATAGNPLFTIELARSVAALPAGTDVEILRHLPLPTGLRGIIGQRFGPLPETVRHGLVCAAVIGEHFEPLLLAQVVGRDEDQIDRVLSAAQHARLVEPVTGPPIRYGFCHDVVRKALYESIPPLRRGRIHLAVAEALEKQHGVDARGHLYELAHHYSEAATRADTAVHYLMLAGDLALEQRAPAAAREFYRRAGHLLPDDGSDGLRRAVKLASGIAAMRLGDPAYRHMLLDVARDAHQAGDAERLRASTIANNRGWYSTTTGVDHDRVAMIEVALESCRPGDRWDRCQLLTIWALERIRDPSMREQAIARSQEALELAESIGDELLIARVLSDHYAVTYAAFGGPRECVALADRLQRIARSRGDDTLQLHATIGLAQSTMMIGDFARADEALRRSAELADHLDLPPRRWMVQCWQAMRLGGQGRLDQAEDAVMAACQFGLQIEQPDALTWFMGQLFSLRLLAGRTGELVDDIAGQVTSHATAIPAWRAAYAVALLDAGRHDDAAQVLDEFVEDSFTALPVDMLWLHGMVYLSIVAAGLGRADTAESLYLRLAPYRTLVANNSTVDAGPVALHLGALARVVDRKDESAEHLRAAIAVCERADLPLWRQWAERELALVGH